MCSYRSCYIIQQSAACGYGTRFLSRDAALCAFIDGTVQGLLDAGVNKSAVFEYRVPVRVARDIEKRVDATGCVAVPDRQFLRRRWFFRNIGDKIGAHYRMRERITHSSHRRRNVLHIYDYKTMCIGPIWVRNNAETAGSRWIVRYRRFQWLSNVRRQTLRRTANFVLDNRLPALLQRRSTQIRQLYAQGKRMDFYMPSHDSVFLFELDGVSSLAFEAKDYVVA